MVTSIFVTIQDLYNKLITNDEKMSYKALYKRASQNDALQNHIPLLLIDRVRNRYHFHKMKYCCQYCNNQMISKNIKELNK